MEELRIICQLMEEINRALSPVINLKSPITPPTKNFTSQNHFHSKILTMPPKNTTERKSPRTTGGWVYATKLTKEEEHVRQEGFPWVSISTIKKQDTQLFFL
jgi:hypothetical protein